MVATSDGQKIEHPQFLRKSERRLKRFQRQLSRKRKGSKNREKARLLLAAQYARVTNQRKDFNHKLITDLVEEHDAVFFEDLQVKNLVKNHALAKSISDSGWGQIQLLAKYKEERKSGIVDTVLAAYSTQECFFCGTHSVSLDVREFECVGCKRWLDRDLDVARVTLKRGCAKVGQDMPELTPMEIGPPPPREGTASLVEEVGTTCGGAHAQSTPPLEAHGLQSRKGVTGA